MISGTSLTQQTRLLSCNRTQSRVVTGLLTVYNTLRKHLYLMGLTNSLLCWRCEAEEEISAYVLCECEALALLKHAYLGSFFLGPRGHTSLKSRGLSRTAGTGLPRLGIRLWGTTGLSKGLGALGPKDSNVITNLI